MVLATSDWVGKSIAGRRYRILGRIGAGSMGHVFRAFDNNLQTEVVIKFPIPGEQGVTLPNLLERFARETRSLVRLSHPHIVKIIDVGVLDDSPYVVMQYLTGGSLKDRMHSGPHGQVRPMPPSSLHDWLLDVARALDFIHAQGHIHRDVKPANILFDAHGNGFLGDFGVIKSLSADDGSASSGSSLSAPGFMLGTPSYVAPEIVMGGSPGGKSDQYSLALTIHEVLTGRNFLVGPSPSATLVNQTNVTPPGLAELVPGISQRLSQAVARAMSKEPAERFASCVAFAHEVLADLPEVTEAEQASYHIAPSGLTPCPACNAIIMADERHKGAEVRCPHCGSFYKVIPQDETVQLSIVDLAKDNSAEVFLNPSAVSYTEFSFTERPDLGVPRPPVPPPNRSANVSYTDFSFTDVPRGDVPETPVRPAGPQPPNVSYTEFSFADRPTLGSSSSSATPLEGSGAGFPKTPTPRAGSRVGMFLVAAGLILALGLAGWPYVKRAWNGDSDRTKQTTAKPGEGDGSSNLAVGSRSPAVVPGGSASVEVNIAYGTEKKNWLEVALREYRATPEGRRSKINLVPLGSLESANAILEGPKPTPIHVWSPASSAYRTMFEQQWKAKHNSPPIMHEQELALTPMVFVIWKHRYDAFIRKYPKVNFRTIGEALAAPTGWKEIADKPDWGHFKFTHTNPRKSNSGFLTLVLMAYETRDKLRDLTVEDVEGSDFRAWLTKFEQRVSRSSGSLIASTGTLMEEMVKKGPSQNDALVVYENLAIDYMDRARARWGDLGELQIIYPDPNVWNDHPYYILNVPWSSEAQKSAARDFLDFLMSEPVQLKALELGFRPGNSSIAVNTPDSPLLKHKENGLKIEVPRICEPPRSEVVSALLSAYDQAEKAK